MGVAAKESKRLTYEKLDPRDKMKGSLMRGRGRAFNVRIKLQDIGFVPCRGDLLAWSATWGREGKVLLPSAGVPQGMSRWHIGWFFLQLHFSCNCDTVGQPSTCIV